MGEFLIKHRSSGKYFYPEGGKDKDETRIVLHKDVCKLMCWTFEKVLGHYGYIKLVGTDKIIHPQGGGVDTSDNTSLVINKDRHDGALFALDVYNHRIVHLNGCFAQAEGSKSNPPNNSRVMLYRNASSTADLLFVSPNVPSEEVHVYGVPKVKGKWEILAMVKNPGAVHKDTFKFTTGKIKANKRDFMIDGKYALEISGGVQVGKIFTASEKESLSVELKFDAASTDTWSEETTRTREILVNPGGTVVTWQYVFTFNHCNTETMFKSNLLADTDSDSVRPEEPQRNL